MDWVVSQHYQRLKRSIEVSLVAPGITWVSHNFRRDAFLLGALLYCC